MQRVGRINMPSYRIVVTEHARSTKTGNFVEKVGSYNPKTKEKKLELERIKYWLSVGAQASPTVHNMLVSLGAINAKKINVLPKYKEPVKEPEAPAAEAPAPAAESAPEVQEESKAEQAEPAPAEAKTE